MKGREKERKEKHPCEKESRKSMYCMAETNGDVQRCQELIALYKQCKKFYHNPPPAPTHDSW